MVKIKPRSNPPSRYVVRDPKTGETSYRVPNVCIQWPQEFRLRVVRDWLPAKTVTKQQAEAYVRYMTTTPFVVQRVGVQFYIKLLGNPPSLPPNGRVIVETLLYADGHASAISLYHSDPAARSLMVYSYLTGEPIVGLPKLRYIEDYR